MNTALHTAAQDAPTKRTTLRELSLLIPALNEEAHLQACVEEVLAIGREHLDRFELLIVDDGSTDRTGAIADELAAQHPEVSVHHNQTPRGLAWSFSKALDQAQCPYFCLIPGDQAFNARGLARVFRVVGDADLIVTYRTNQYRNRDLHRVLLSLVYKRIMVSLFRYHLLDYHSMVVYPVKQLRALELRAGGYLFQLESIVQLVRLGLDLVQVPVPLNREEAGSRSLKLKTFVDVGTTLWRLKEFIPGRRGRLLRNTPHPPEC